MWDDCIHNLQNPTKPWESRYYAYDINLIFEYMSIPDIAQFWLVARTEEMWKWESLDYKIQTLETAWKNIMIHSQKLASLQKLVEL